MKEIVHVTEEKIGGNGGRRGNDCYAYGEGGDGGRGGGRRGKNVVEEEEMMVVSMMA